MDGKVRTTAIVIALVALVIGGGAGYALGMNKDDSTKADASNSAMSEKTTATKAADLRALLNNLESEHVDLASAATRQGFNTGNLKDPQFVATANALAKNTDELTAAITSVYGEQAGMQFKQIWSSHIGFFVDYTVAAKTGNKAGMDKAVQNLNGYVDAISDFFSKANPNLPKEAVAALVSEHVKLLKEAVDKHGAGDYEGSYKAQEQAREQITTKIADTIAGAIVKQNQNSF